MRVAKIFEHQGGGGGVLKIMAQILNNFERLNFMQTLLALSLKNSESNSKNFS